MGTNNNPIINNRAKRRLFNIRFPPNLPEFVPGFIKYSNNLMISSAGGEKNLTPS
jgi:hypothetical protein